MRNNFQIKSKQRIWCNPFHKQTEHGETTFELTFKENRVVFSCFEREFLLVLKTDRGISFSRSETIISLSFRKLNYIFETKWWHDFSCSADDSRVFFSKRQLGTISDTVKVCESISSLTCFLEIEASNNPFSLMKLEARKQCSSSESFLGDGLQRSTGGWRVFLSRKLFVHDHYLCVLFLLPSVATVLGHPRHRPCPSWRVQR